jgi:hypothetical protein
LRTPGDRTKEGCQQFTSIEVESIVYGPTRQSVLR